VAEDGGQREAPLAVRLADVGVADPGSHDAHEHLAGPGLAELDFLDPVRLARSVENGRPRPQGAPLSESASERARQ
jgi:hypothetical protein